MTDVLTSFDKTERIADLGSNKLRRHRRLGSFVGRKAGNHRRAIMADNHRSRPSLLFALP